MRLNKYIAQATGLSRRQADDAISRGRAEIFDENGKSVSFEDFAKFSDSQLKKIVIKVDHKQISLPDKKTLIILNKPRGYVSSRKAQAKDATTLYKLLPEKYSKLKSVGRLDKDSSGLILLTDDGDFAQRMTHPSFAKNKTYLVRLDADLQPLHQQMISDFGVELPDGKSRLNLTRIESASELSANDFSALKTNEKFEENSRKIWRVQMSEGKNRQIRRTFSALGYEVLRLHRTEFGEYILGDLNPGEVREI